VDGIARVAGTRVRYVKPHGALYATAADDEAQANAVVDAVSEYDMGLAVLGLPASALLRAADAAGLRTVAEGFADRGYLASGRLAPRSHPGGLVVDPALVAGRALAMAGGEIVAVDGTVVRQQVESICIHGDTPGAVTLAIAVRQALNDAGVALSPFCVPA